MIFWFYEYVLVTLLMWLIPTLTARNTYTLRRALNTAIAKHIKIYHSSEGIPLPVA
jgi:hypothetical protein